MHLHRVAASKGGRTKRVQHAGGVPALSNMCPDDFGERFPDGRMWSDSSLATAEAGRKLYEAAVRDAVHVIEQWIESSSSNTADDVAAAAEPHTQPV
jgi:creatinine amidohydrolase/Fe(II)-dependent formamide hydrolase-like protein